MATQLRRQAIYKDSEVRSPAPGLKLIYSVTLKKVINQEFTSASGSAVRRANRRDLKHLTPSQQVLQEFMMLSVKSVSFGQFPRILPKLSACYEAPK